MTEPRLITLSNLEEGIAETIFGEAFQEVLENIDDPNTSATVARKITLTFTFKPKEDRRNVDVAIDCSKRLAGSRPHGTTIFVARHLGKLAAVEPFRQADLFPTPHGRPQAVEPTPAADEAVSQGE